MDRPRNPLLPAVARSIQLTSALDSGKAEAQLVVPVAEQVSVAICRAAVRTRVVEAAATVDAVGTAVDHTRQ